MLKLNDYISLESKKIDIDISNESIDNLFAIADKSIMALESLINVEEYLSNQQYITNDALIISKEAINMSYMVLGVPYKTFISTESLVSLEGVTDTIVKSITAIWEFIKKICKKIVDFFRSDKVETALKVSEVKVKKVVVILEDLGEDFGSIELSYSDIKNKHQELNSIIKKAFSQLKLCSQDIVNDNSVEVPYDISIDTYFNMEMQVLKNIKLLQTSKINGYLDNIIKELQKDSFQINVNELLNTILKDPYVRVANEILIPKEDNLAVILKNSDGNVFNLLMGNGSDKTIHSLSEFTLNTKGFFASVLKTNPTKFLGKLFTEDLAKKFVNYFGNVDNNLNDFKDSIERQLSSHEKFIDVFLGLTKATNLSKKAPAREKKKASNIKLITKIMTAIVKLQQEIVKSLIQLQVLISSSYNELVKGIGTFFNNKYSNKVE